MGEVNVTKDKGGKVEKLPEKKGGFR
jgi:hypothetical protein